MNLLALVLALTPCQAEPVITHNFGIQWGDKMVEEVGREMGQTWKGTGYLNRDLVYANLKGLTLTEVKASLAKVLNGSWSTKDGVEVLHSSVAGVDPYEELLRRMVRDEFARARRMPTLTRSYLVELKKSSKESPPESDTPEQRAGAKAMLALGMDVILGLKEGDMLYYTDGSEGAARSLPLGVKSAFDQYRAEKKLWDEVMLDSRAADTRASEEEGSAPSRASRPPLHLIIERLGRTISLGIALTSSDGHRDYSGSSWAFTAGEETTRVVPDGIAGNPLFEKPLREGVDPAPDLGPFQYKGSAGLPLEERFKLCPEAVASLSDDKAADPVQVGLGRELDQFCGSFGSGLLAMVPDEALRFCAVEEGRDEKLHSPPLKELLGDLCQPALDPAEISFEETGTTLVLTGASKAYSRATRMDRPALRKLARDVISLESRIEAIANFLQRDPRLSSGELAFDLVCRTFECPMEYPWGTDLQLIKLYAGLSSSQRKDAAGSGVVVDLDAIPPHLSAIVHRCVFGSGKYVVVPRQASQEQVKRFEQDSLERAEEIAASGGWIRELLWGGANRYASFDYERPATALPAGIPRSSKLLLQHKRVPQIFGYSRRPEGNPRWEFLAATNPDRLAWAQIIKEETGEAATAMLFAHSIDPPKSLDRFTIGWDDLLIADFDFAGVGHLDAFVVRDGLPVNPKFVDKEELPPDFLKANQEALKKNRAERERMLKERGEPGRQSSLLERRR